MAIIIYAIGPFTRNFREFLMILQKFVLRNEEIFPFIRENLSPPKFLNQRCVKIYLPKKFWFFSILFYFTLFYLSYFLLVLFFFSFL